jgi:beta-phosphoglucomutase family hydrolase
MNNENGKGVVFDMDGVLIDSSAYHKQSWIDVGDEEGYTMTEAFFYDTFGMQNHEIIPQLMGQPISRSEIDRIAFRKEERYRELVGGDLELLEGVEALLQNLRENGYRLAIGTSTPRINLEFMLTHTPMAPYFDDCVAGEDVQNSKPAPDTFLKGAERLGLPPHCCVVVEDAIPGVAAGKAAGMPVIAVTNTRKAEELQQADRIVDSLTELSATDFDRLLQL